ncbi:DUF3147 family protein [Acetobacter fallax]|uniref:DUF3147 family protein n=1 Tax=Acetobacter fallax TaxID=1737473 RepID=A0ABX0K7B8_9PROT|nr:DUF3147 family protein [Acetobacter fallax]NHO31113.1 hypothetical protein [Acetobacter fallax]NHO34670.1 hypothetical protein [Acetobacter fallax]
MFFFLKAALSGVLIALISTIARRYPALGALVASLPLISVFGMIWLWLETHDPVRMETHVSATFFYVIPSLPMFLLIPWLMRRGVPFWPALLVGCSVTVVLYLLTILIARRAGYSL